MKLGHPSVETFRRFAKSQPLAKVRTLTRTYLAAIPYAKTPELKQLFAELAEIGKAELERNKWSL